MISGGKNPQNATESAICQIKVHVSIIFCYNIILQNSKRQRQLWTFFYYENF